MHWISSIDWSQAPQVVTAVAVSAIALGKAIMALVRWLKGK